MNVVTTVISWLIGKAFEAALLAVWLLLYVIGVLAKTVVWFARGRQPGVPLTHWDHGTAAQKLAAPDEIGHLEYCGRGGWQHRLYRYYLSQVVYVYTTHRRVLVVSKNRGCHEFDLATVSLETDDSTGTLHLQAASHAVYLGYVPAEAIREVVAAVHARTNMPR